MTLCQFYDDYTRKHYKMDWNTYCALTQIPAIKELKKKLKQQYKLAKELQ